MNFTPEQNAAIDISRRGQDAAIVAGPGSGKTTVLVERYRKLIEAGVAPANILAITFTEKSAANMRARMAREFAGDPDMLQQLDRAWVSTIHGFCMRLLRQNATSAGVDPGFTVLEEQHARLEQATAARRALDGLFMERPAEMRELLDATGLQDLEALILPIYDAMRAAGVTPAQLRRQAGRDTRCDILNVARRYAGGFDSFLLNPKQREARDAMLEFIERFENTSGIAGSYRALATFAANKQIKNPEKAALFEIDDLKAELLDLLFDPQRQLLVNVFEDFEARYRGRKIALGKLDFNDLEFHAVRLLESDGRLRTQIQEQFEQVMMDEFQDTSKLQARLISLVAAPGRFYAVGDLNQSIYSFRHASPEVFQAHRARVEETGQHCCELVENWRSRQPILNAAQFILNGAVGIEPRDLKAARAFPPSERPHIEIIEVTAPETAEPYRLEAQWIAQRILELARTIRIHSPDGSDRAPRLNDFAVLVRNTAVLPAFVTAFDDACIAFNLNRRTGFLETREAHDLAHLLRVLNNPWDEVSAVTVLRSQFCGISDAALLALKGAYPNLGAALAPGADWKNIGPEDASRLQRFSALLHDLRSAEPFAGVDRVILRALDRAGVVWDPSTPGGQNIEKFLAIARSSSAMSLSQFIEFLASMRQNDPREPDSPIDEQKNAVQIMTVHAAKGLEFPVVIIAALDKGIAASQTGALNFTPEHGLGVKWAFEGAAPRPGRIHVRNAKKLEQTDDEESHRLLYVGLTRAQEHLILSWTRTPDKKPGNWAKLVGGQFQIDSVPLSPEPSIETFQAANREPFQAQLLRCDTPPSASTAAEPQAPAREIQIVEAPPVTDRFNPNTTATALAQFGCCPRKFFLRPFLGWERDLVVPQRAPLAGGRSHAADIGTEVHQLLAGRPVPDPALASLSLAETFERSSLRRRSKKAIRTEHEWEFVLALDRLIVRGSVDLWFEEPRGITVVDYKTDDLPGSAARDRARDYELQLQIYALALARATGRPVVEAWLYFLTPDIAVSVPLAPAAANIAALSQDLIRAEEQMTFPMRPGPACRRCEFFRTLCPARIPQNAHA